MGQIQEQVVLKGTGVSIDVEQTTFRESWCIGENRRKVDVIAETAAIMIEIL